MTHIERLLKAVSDKLNIYETFLNEGADEKSIEAVAATTGLEVPATLAELLLKHNGEKKFLGFLSHGF